MNKVVFVILVLIVGYFIVSVLMKPSGNSQKQSSQSASPQKEASQNSGGMHILTGAFDNNAQIPAMYTCDGTNLIPPMQFTNVPQEAKSLVLIMDDPDAPNGTFTHWVLYNMNPTTTGIPEGTLPDRVSIAKNGAGKAEYTGPCPPSGTHHYYFRLFALDKMLELGADADRAAVEKAMEGHIKAKAEIIGVYEKKK